MKKYFIVFFIISSAFLIFFFINYNVENNTQLFYKYKNKIPLKVKYEIRKYLTKINSIFVYKKNNFKFERKKNSIQLEENIPGDELILFNNSDLIFTGPRAYFASDRNNLFLITGTGILMTIQIKKISINEDHLNFEKINTNINDFLKPYKNEGSIYSKTSMIKNLMYKNGSLIVSYIKKINDTCYKHSIIEGKVDIKSIKFREFFTINECREFYSDYVGGNLANYKDNKILYTVGDWSICEDSRWLKKGKGFCTKNNSQSMSSALGKIFEIDFFTKKSNIISIGHDNPQGIFYDSDHDTIFSTEHGPKGGDELNININPSITKFKNYGYPISSYGEHYGYPNPGVNYKYEEAPLYKSHKQFGFEEPIDYFVPSIGISDIEKIGNKLLVGSLGSNIDQGDLSFFIYSLDEKQKIIERKTFKIFQRIRDIHVLDKHILLFLETSGSIAVYKRS
jgi:hypothetical protein